MGEYVLVHWAGTQIGFTITEKIPYCDGSLIIGYAILICRIVLVALTGFDR